ncbi:hypothetical protein C2G38_2240938 [Gigaspora rosea]|uniref:Ubiquitinyl hydrolase 1 n=1 Tax=Gigaspora rosea TaxID=44941 RepID=A0A397W440_9GLOM|nr:hypothetical protein C2G38_2240938 [Gigaspora rosea]
MPDLYHNVKDFQYHTWHVTDWKNLEKRLTGPEFKVGGWNWRLLIFPMGNYNYHDEDHVGIYLDFVDPYNDLHITAQFALIIWNQEEPTKFVSHDTYHTFTNQEFDWGFTEFYDKDKLFVPADGRTRPIIENDACNITVLIRILEDPTGYIGLKSQRVNTFLNPVLQLLYHLKYLQKALYHIPIESDKSVKSITSALQRIFYQLNVSDTEVETTELTKFFGWDTFNMSDIREFIQVLEDDLENKMKNTKADGTINKLFVGTKKTYIKCVNVDYEYQCAEDYYDIQFTVKEDETLDDSFMKFIQEEDLVGNNKYDAERYGLQSAKKRVTFESFPPVLRIYLNYDAETDFTSDNHYGFPAEIDLQKYLSSEVDKSKSCRYLLYGVLVYNSSNKKYSALVRPEINRGWIKFNDDKVTLESFGEMFRKHNGAYMLIYICDSDVNEILSPIPSEDIPKCLPEEESDLHIQTWVVSEEIFKSHRGLGIADFNNEQYPFYEPFQFKISKEITYSAFKMMISVKFEIPIDQIKLWVIDNTIKLQEPITDDFLDESMEKVRTKLVNSHDLVNSYDELKLYMEVLEKPMKKQLNHNDESLQNNEIIIFLKYFNPDVQSLEGLGHLYVKKNSRIDSVFPIIRKKMKLSPKTLFDIYEEFASYEIKNIIPEFTFQMAGMLNGSIICVQKTLTNIETQKLVDAGRICNIAQFYESLSMNIVVQFKSKFGYKDSIPEFNLVLNKNMTYEKVVRQIAIYLNTDPSRLRFTSEYPKKEIDATTSQTLSEILQSSTCLYYEIFDTKI